MTLEFEWHFCTIHVTETWDSASPWILPLTRALDLKNLSKKSVNKIDTSLQKASALMQHVLTKYI